MPFYVVSQYEKAVVFRWGKQVTVLGAGLHWRPPVADVVRRVDLRIRTVDVSRQHMMTKDNVPVAVDAVVFMRVSDPVGALTKVQDYRHATELIAQTSLRAVVGQVDLDALLANRQEVNSRIAAIIDDATDAWGVKVVSVELKDVSLPDSLKRAMATQAESERERRAKIINAEGEFQASAKLLEAAQMMAKEPMTLQLRFLQTMHEISSNGSTTTFLPIPIDLFSSMAPSMIGGAVGKTGAVAPGGR